MSGANEGADERVAQYYSLFVAVFDHSAIQESAVDRRTNTTFLTKTRSTKGQRTDGHAVSTRHLFLTVKGSNKARR